MRGLSSSRRYSIRDKGQLREVPREELIRFLAGRFVGLWVLAALKHAVLAADLLNRYSQMC